MCTVSCNVLVDIYRYCTGVLLVTVSIAGLLVMVSSELVVLLIVCVGIKAEILQGTVLYNMTSFVLQVIVQLY